MYEDFIVPQELNISDRIGKFTFPQLGFLAGGMLIVMTMFITESIPMLVSLLVGIPIMLFCLVMAFFKRYDMPMYEFIIVFIQFKAMPRESIYSALEKENEIFDFEEEDEVVLL